MSQGIEEALSLGAVSHEAIKHLILARLEKRPPSLNLLAFPHIPAVHVEKTSLGSYDVLRGAAS